ncbi:MAG: hypothetical protein FJ134_15930 [Deltaproteobacteria bacterium]|nr:hypothetical protein [Deltaproteobacteria bacterium]
MAIPNMEKVQFTIKPFESTLANIPRQALRDYLKSHLNKVTNHPRVKSNSIWGYMVYYARKAFGENPNFQFIEHYGTVSIVIDGLNHQVLFRLKKADKRGVSRNIQTKLSDAFYDHNQRYIFPEIDPDRIEVVYIIDNLGIKIEDVKVVGRNGKQVVWSYSIMQKAKVIKSPVTSSTQAIPDGRARVRGVANLPKDKKKQGE